MKFTKKELLDQLSNKIHRDLQPLYTHDIELDIYIILKNVLKQEKNIIFKSSNHENYIVRFNNSDPGYMVFNLDLTNQDILL